jgi:hypothetical protein
MKLGRVEKLVLILLKHKKMDTTTLSKFLRIHGYFRTDRSVRRAVHSLRRKGCLDTLNRLTGKGRKLTGTINMIDTNLDIGKLDAMPPLNMRMRLGIREKTFLYILSKIDRAAVQFLATVSGESPKYTSEILRKLELKELVYGHNSVVLFTNAKGKRYRPRYYGITEYGKLLSSIVADDVKTRQEAMHIDRMLEEMKSKIL